MAGQPGWRPRPLGLPGWGQPGLGQGGRVLEPWGIHRQAGPGQADGEAGMTPPLVAMASRFRAPPRATRGIPGNCQLAARNSTPSG
jgi:hypothetical protein